MSDYATLTCYDSFILLKASHHTYANSEFNHLKLKLSKLNVKAYKYFKYPIITLSRYLAEQS